MIKHNRMPKSVGESILIYGIYLGQSHTVKDCFWDLYLFSGKYYASVNGLADGCYLIDKNTFQDWCEIPSDEYLQLLEEEKATDAADKLSSNKYNF